MCEELYKISKNIPDPYWKSVFLNLSRGKSHTNVFITEKYLSIYDQHKRVIMYPLDENKESTNCDEIIMLYHKHLKIYSPQEYEKLYWKDDKPFYQNTLHKNKLELLIDRFCIEKSKTYNFADNKKKKLLNLIHLALTLKLITDKDIVYENEPESGKIVKINHFYFSNNDFKICFNIKFSYSQNLYVDSKNNKSIENLWKKYK